MKSKLNIKTMLIVVAIIALIALISVAIKVCIDNATVNKQMKNAVHAVTINEDVELYKSPKRSKNVKKLKMGTDVYILENTADEDGNKLYKVKADNKVGYIVANKVDYYKTSKMKKELMLDVSQFNLQNNFSSIGEFKAFVLNNHIKYVYIRAGGRGYGQAGNFYKDTNYKDYADACEFMQIPFGFYFLEEAITSEEVDEEINFIQNFLQENEYKYNKLPIALDIEKHVEKGRADDIWDTRYVLVNEMIDKLQQKNKKVIIYSNASIANQYLTGVNTQMWLAYYPNIKEKPNYWYSDTDGEGASNKDLISKMVAWQFTETGIENKINKKVDISLVYNNFFLSGSTEDIKKDMSGSSKRVLRAFNLKDKWKNNDIFSFGRIITI